MVEGHGEIAVAESKLVQAWRVVRRSEVLVEEVMVGPQL